MRRPRNEQTRPDRFASPREWIIQIRSQKVVDLTFQSLRDTLAQGDRVELRGLGTFAVKEYDAYQGRNPKTGEAINVKPKKLPFFKVGKEFKKRLNSK